MIKQHTYVTACQAQGPARSSLPKTAPNDKTRTISINLYAFFTINVNKTHKTQFKSIAQRQYERTRKKNRKYTQIGVRH